MNWEKAILGTKQGLLVFAVMLFLNGCGSNEKSAGESLRSGTVHVSADESFKPVIDSQIQVFESSYPDAKVIVHYKPEAECLKDFAVDSIGMVIATRGFTKNEEQFMLDSLNTLPSKMTAAYDAIAVVVHPEAKDSLFTMEELKALLTGKSSLALRPVFDGTKATSTVRFIIDSVLKGQPLGSNVTAAQSSEGVIDYVSKTKDAIGFLGVNWIGNKEDSTQLTYLKKVKVAQLEHPLLPGVYVTPAQYNIYYRRYPMVRDLIYTLKEKENGVGHGFAYFLTGQRGQLIFKRSYLMPAQMNFNLRTANLRE